MRERRRESRELGKETEIKKRDVERKKGREKEKG